MNMRWRIALLISAAIAISYLDRQTLPLAIGEIRKEIPISNQIKAFLDSAFLVTYGLMYLGGGRLVDRLGTQRGFLIIMTFWSLACASHAFAANYGVAPFHGLPFAVIMLASSRLLLGVGEGGGFPAATRAIAEWFPVNERSTAMGIINAGTAVGLMDYDFRWHIGDRTSILSDGYADRFGDGLKTASIGLLLNRPARGNFYIGFRSATGTFEALNWMMFGGCMPGGAMRSTALLCAEICAIAVPISAPCWK